MTAEQKRLLEARERTIRWKYWGPYLTERQWGTVREDYSKNGDAWNYTPHEHARSKAYRWGEEGIGGICDRRQRLCFAPAFWNGQDSILKERLFGLTGPEGNHGEDVKEYYYYLDSTPTHSYMKMLYKYPHAAFPYEELVAKNQERSKQDPEFELVDTGVFKEDKYFDIFMEYAKVSHNDILIRIHIHNRSSQAATLDLLPTIWFRNTWAWGYRPEKPKLSLVDPLGIQVHHQKLDAMQFYAQEEPERWLFCENDSNKVRLYGEEAICSYPKDGINDYVVHQQPTINPQNTGTKAAAHYQLNISGKESHSLLFRLGPQGLKAPFAEANQLFMQRQSEADAFFQEKQAKIVSEDEREIHRQAIAGMMWGKQYYYFDVPQWLEGDPATPPPPTERKSGRNKDWLHLNNADIISMPDKWEYPWYAAWDLAFHCLTFALVDVDFAKRQLKLFTKEWYMHPNGQLPAYEWNFGDVNPPVHAWACWKVYQMEKKQTGKGDRKFLEEVFHKLLINFTWWVNRKDHEDNNIFQGGFLGLDNIGVFDRSAELPTGGNLEQADGTSWMAMYSLNLMRIAIELANENSVYQKTATKFFEHFLYIAGAMANVGNIGIDLWDEEDQFFYDVLSLPSGEKIQLKVRSLVGLAPLFAVEVLDHTLLEKHEGFARRLQWFLKYRPDLANLVSRWQENSKYETHLLSLLRGHRMKKLLKRMLDEAEFLSDFGVRGLSRFHKENPYVFETEGDIFKVGYQAGESDTNMFGGNSNWRGPIWFPMNYLLIEALYKFHSYYGEEFRVEYPTGSGKKLSLKEIAQELSKRLVRIFTQDASGNRAVFGKDPTFQHNPHFRNHILFYEYFHGDSGRGIGASHQTGWTGLIANLITELAEED